MHNLVENGHLANLKRTKTVSFKEILVLGHIINPITDKKADYYPHGAMLLREKTVGDKKVFKVFAIGEREKIFTKAKNTVHVWDFADDLIIPTFFDMHFHWVQDDVRMMPKADLLEWLENHTFPSEAKFKNKKFARAQSRKFFNRLVQTGTLGGACYSSVHEHALEYAMNDAVGDFVIGNVLMTMNSPKELLQKREQAVGLVDKLSKKYSSRYALTPRFAIATDPETMKASGKLAKKQKSFIQSHLSETKGEIDFVTSLYKGMKSCKNIKNYTDIYKKVGLLSSRTIMGHGIHLKPEELDVLAKSKTAIAHCPTSNAPHKELGLGSGLFNFKIIEKKGIPWALGSDIGGGPYLSMFDVMRSFVAQNKKAKVTGATYTKALYRSTKAGAEILKMGKKKGNLSTGMEGNFMVLSGIKFKKDDKAEDILARLVDKHKKDRENYDDLPDKVIYQGNIIYSKD